MCGKIVPMRTDIEQARHEYRSDLFTAMSEYFEDAPLAIRTFLEGNGTSAASIAKDLGVSRRMVSLVIRGERRSKGHRIEQAVADAIGLQVNEVFEYVKGDA